MHRETQPWCHDRCCVWVYRLSVLVNVAAAAAPAPAFGQEREKSTPSTVHLPSYANPQPLDNLVLATQPLMQRGVARSAQKPQRKLPPGVWPFRPVRDTFRHDALLDLRVSTRRLPDRADLFDWPTMARALSWETANPARFWGVTTYVQRDRSPEDLAHHARFLAKRGVNMVRLHGHMDPKDKNARVTDVDDEGHRRGLEARRRDEERGDLCHDQPVLVGERQARAVRNGESRAGRKTKRRLVCCSSIRSFKKATRLGSKRCSRGPIRTRESRWRRTRAGDHPASE